MLSRLALVAVCAFACLPARAGLHEFTLQGQVTQASGWPNVAVGDPFTIKYVANDADQDASATIGRYDASDAVVTLPNTTIVSEGLGHANVRLQQPSGFDVVSFASTALNYQFTIQFTFPSGTLASDALPLTLPPLSPPALLDIYDFGPIVRGSITSYSSTPVPEPNAAAGLLLVLLSRTRQGVRKRA